MTSQQDRHPPVSVPILMYHSISEPASARFANCTLSPSLFADHVAYLHEQGYTPLTVTDLVRAFAGAAPVLPLRPVVLTFDDGYADFYTAALPVLDRFGFVATLYVSTAFVGDTSRWLHDLGEGWRPMLTWNQLRSLDAHGIECGAHGHMHRILDTLPHHLVHEEVISSKRLLEEHLGREIASFSYPHGRHSRGVRQMVRDAGFSSACIVNHAMASPRDDPFRLQRLWVTSHTDVAGLARLLARRNSALEIAFKEVRYALWRVVRRFLMYFERGSNYGGTW